MSYTRPSISPLVAEDSPKVFQEVTNVDGRGRVHLLPRWIGHVDWVPKKGSSEIEALLILVEPGRVSIRSWGADRATHSEPLQRDLTECRRGGF